jgi:hypothetical protein
MPPAKTKGVKPRDVILLVHGIRTQAFWFTVAKKTLEESLPGVDVKLCGFGYFNTFQFLFPFFTRNGPRDQFIKTIRNLKFEYERSGVEIRISVIAHSFGTYMVDAALKYDRTIDIYNLILCGSVLRRKSDVAQIIRQISNKRVNDVGAKDIWPVMARIGSFGYGDSGTFGFQQEYCEDRHFDLTHSGFLNSSHIKKYWVPIFRRNDVVTSPFLRDVINESKVIQLLASLPEGAIPAFLLAGFVSAIVVFESFGGGLSLHDHFLYRIHGCARTSNYLQCVMRYGG